MQKIHFKQIIITLALILLFNSVFLPYLMPVSELKAASIEKEDIYTGLGLMFLLVVLSGGKSSNKEVAVRDDFYSYKNFSADEIEILASIINAEARGESYQGKVAVGAVIINRVYHPSFPNSIREVVYQTGQFTPVENGMIDLSPDNDSFKAAYDAVSGLDPSQGSLYFYNPAKSRNPEFFAKRDKVVTIGNHVFLK
ncbi:MULTISPECIES: cell wall hydrolase [Halanaerobium]|uniref:N-acetylmuramoyl-L-alanine amidase n=2 Tax=Halanaerobium TaxID=2330 RepID=A0A2T5RPI7_9FIRM|nr:MULTISPECIES: cell wall hydrolase [Halanaerobium]PTW01723.1 N-acetylmuramoyl-L-alanine amidase [Halanaerobium saccharolyticum]RCW55637.1 N-acetylmuramoyl-L-alanine amidase [Halanaerobium sp. ST460_2HS_T2]SIQ06660.1 N-acetylmuramoyl-L-alanine amidase [Halanaerobium kushneri]